MGVALSYNTRYVTRENLKDSFVHAGIKTMTDSLECDRDNVGFMIW